MGTVEVDDQIEATRLLLEKHKFMDKKRVGIWGWVSFY
jgi:dipeptidyl aminopeptidase/acylaminoacyl peptidase